MMCCQEFQLDEFVRFQIAIFLWNLEGVRMFFWISEVRLDVALWRGLLSESWRGAISVTSVAVLIPFKGTYSDLRHRTKTSLRADCSCPARHHLVHHLFFLPLKSN